MKHLIEELWLKKPQPFSFSLNVNFQINKQNFYFSHFRITVIYPEFSQMVENICFQ